MTDVELREMIDPKEAGKPLVRCDECDREVEHYNTYLLPTNMYRHVCWRCTARMEKGFNAKPDFHRSTRRGVVPR